MGSVFSTVKRTLRHGTKVPSATALILRGRCPPCFWEGIINYITIFFLIQEMGILYRHPNLQDVPPSFLVEEILTKMLRKSGLCCLDLLFCHHLSNQPLFQNVLKSKEEDFFELPSSAFKVGVDFSRVWRILEVMRNLKKKPLSEIFEIIYQYILAYTRSEPKSECDL